MLLLNNGYKLKFSIVYNAKIMFFFDVAYELQKKLIYSLFAINLTLKEGFGLSRYLQCASY